MLTSCDSLESTCCTSNPECCSAGGSGHADVASMLLEVGADVRISDDAGHTAVLYASRHGHLAVVRVLIEAASARDAAARRTRGGVGRGAAWDAMRHGGGGSREEEVRRLGAAESGGVASREEL